MLFDQSISKKFHRTFSSTKLLSYAARFCATDLIWILLILSAGFYWVRQPSVMAVVSIGLLGLTVVVVWGVALLLEIVFKRERPYEELKFKPLINLTIHTPSFPSAHTSIAFAMASVIFMISPMESIVFFLAAALIGIGRMAAGVHYLSDVLAGAVVGFAVPLLLPIMMDVLLLFIIYETPYSLL